jgi:hypothetical protein
MAFTASVAGEPPFYFSILRFGCFHQQKFINLTWGKSGHCSVEKESRLEVISREAQLFVGWVSGSVTHAGVGFHASTQPTFILYLIPPTHLDGSFHNFDIQDCSVSSKFFLPSHAKIAIIFTVSCRRLVL